MKFFLSLVASTLGIFRLSSALEAQEPMLVEPQLLHLRSGIEREWDEFPRDSVEREWTVRFTGRRNAEPWTLRLRQQDVKQRWQVILNEKPLGELIQDENDITVQMVVPSELLVEGENRLVIHPATPREPNDDIRVGQVVLYPRSVEHVLAEAKLDIRVIDQQTGEPLPCRLTIENEGGSLVPLGRVEPVDRVAVRSGTVYTATGEAQIPLAAGKYRITAGRGFEYSIGRQSVELESGGATRALELVIRREVDTQGYVALDPHIHSLTHSGHGDATVEERMITLAGEGIELPVATDHNVVIDHRPFAEALDVRRWFTPVIGNEVTTPVGHFDVLPIEPSALLPKHQVADWNTLFDDFDRTCQPDFVILNHARDLHSGVRPFGPKRFNEITGEQREGWPYRFHAMEVINSSATQSEPMQLLEDWMALLSRGHQITPIGSSDSHDVLRHFVGQGRTYVRSDDSNVGQIDVEAAVRALRQGQVKVSYGLLVSLNVGALSSGDILRSDADHLAANVTVHGPHWVSADRVMLYVNGRLLEEREISTASPRSRPGVIWEGEFLVPNDGQDVHLVAIASGPGLKEPFWRAAKPYQPRSSQWQAMFLGCSGVLWWDADADGAVESPRAVAEALLQQHSEDFESLAEAAARYDEVTSAHLAELIYHHPDRTRWSAWNEIVSTAAMQVRQGTMLYRRAEEAGIRAEAEAQQ